MICTTPKKLRSAARYWRNRAPQAAQRLDEAAQQLQNITIAATATLKLLQRLDAETAVRLPFPGFESCKAALVSAVGPIQEEDQFEG